MLAARLMIGSLSVVLLCFSVERVESRSLAADHYYALSAELFDIFGDPIKRCGKHIVGGWNIKVGFQDDGAGTPTTGSALTNFNTMTGVWQAPFTGIYFGCYNFRLAKGSTSDFTVHKKTSSTTEIITAMGGRVNKDTDWSTYSTCFLVEMTAGDQMWIRLESGGAEDCYEDTEYHYGKFDIALYGPTA